MNDQARGIDLHNETAVNVAGLLREPIGSKRVYKLHLDIFRLAEDVVAAGVEGDVKLTRLADGVMVNLRVRGTAELECVRCLRGYDQGFETEFMEEFRQSVDLRSGVALAIERDDETATIDENHELDFGEVLRQESILALPMRPDCGAACPGPDLREVGAAETGDDRLAVLSRLLNEMT